MDLYPRHQEEDLEVSMSPMIDMVFLLLIFFLVASNIIDTKVPVEIPSAPHAVVPEDETGRFEISLQEDGTLFVGQTPVTLVEMQQRIIPELEANPDLRILIRADRRSLFRHSEAIMEACAEIGAVDLIFSAFEM